MEKNTLISSVITIMLMMVDSADVKELKCTGFVSALDLIFLSGRVSPISVCQVSMEICEV